MTVWAFSGMLSTSSQVSRVFSAISLSISALTPKLGRIPGSSWSPCGSSEDSSRPGTFRNVPECASALPMKRKCNGAKSERPSTSNVQRARGAGAPLSTSAGPTLRYRLPSSESIRSRRRSIPAMRWSRPCFSSGVNSGLPCGRKMSRPASGTGRVGGQTAWNADFIW